MATGLGTLGKRSEQKERWEQSAPSSQGTPLSSAEERQKNRTRLRWMQTTSPLVWLSMTVLAGIVICALFAEVIAPHDPTRNDLINRLQPPAFAEGGSWAHLLGTDQLGRDILSRLIYGARISMTIAVLGTLLGAAIGVACGLISGFIRGRVDEGMMLLVDAYIALPFIIVALSVIAMLGSSMTILTLLAAFAGWASYTRISRGLAISVREEQYVLAARAIGVSGTRIVLRHILPNIFAPLLVLTTFQLTSIILLEASLSFLGFGIQPPTPGWGLMVNEGREYLHSAWWVGVLPGAVIMLVAISINLIGDWLRDVLDPTLRT